MKVHMELDASRAPSPAREGILDRLSHDKWVDVTLKGKRVPRSTRHNSDEQNTNDNTAITTKATPIINQQHIDRG